MMKIARGIVIVAGLAFIASGCQKSEVVSPFTGNETTYSLQPAAQYNVSGTLRVQERKDGKIDATITLTGTSGDVQYPVHLHLGDISTVGADVALLMNPVQSKTGKSETVFNRLSDESSITYQQLLNLQACVKIHLGDTGADRDVVLVAGNIGSSLNVANGGRLGVSVCKSE